MTQPELPVVSPLDRGQGRSALSPKRPSEDTAGLADVFPYYAGFGYDWARALLKSLDVADTAVVLDPWNGSGTTTLAAQHEGFRAVGIDRNPVANIVARLRADAYLTDQKMTVPSAVQVGDSEFLDDPLCAWFTPGSTKRIREWADHLSSLPTGESGLPYVALFRSIRALTSTFEGSNPTWVKRAKSNEDLVTVSAADFDSMLMEQQEFIASRAIPSSDTPTPPVNIATALSDALPVANDCVDVVLTSPPYLTRIDYAVAYTRELAVLGYDISKDRTLRSALMGTTLIRKNTDPNLLIGETARSLIEDVTSHSSKASSGYYRKQVVQYLSDLSAGLDEVTRVTKDGASLHLVVQDSYYKDIPVKLADICVEECAMRGWDLESLDPYVVKRTLTSVNRAARKYKKADVSETVITLRKA
ncbi:site-specific DNA-methyltransferase [Streptomyces sp. NBC_00006]|uniref:hypothetical protein n=1 Tax=Streptomyces sp. NBC_00006 TaxID=2975619 RepID=UPI002254A05E|nr:hypothetical protein [Streptomyces sp. NBC_00006]MCX5532205.1 site-specific DNA-methyltransferase [Streptomyces sp. NBC_00006]